MRRKIGQAEIPMKPDHRLRDNFLVEAEGSEPLSRIHDEFGNTPALGILIGLGVLLQSCLVFSAHRTPRERRTPYFPREGPLSRLAPHVLGLKRFGHRAERPHGSVTRTVTRPAKL